MNTKAETGFLFIPSSFDSPLALNSNLLQLQAPERGRVSKTDWDCDNNA